MLSIGEFVTTITHLGTAATTHALPKECDAFLIMPVAAATSPNGDFAISFGKEGAAAPTPVFPQTSGSPTATPDNIAGSITLGDMTILITLPYMADSIKCDASTASVRVSIFCYRSR